MRDEHVPLRLIDMHIVNGVSDSVSICPYVRNIFTLFIVCFDHCADMHRFQEREHVKIHLTILVIKAEHVYPAIISSCEVYPALVHDPRSERQPLSGIVISAYDEYLNIHFSEFADKIIKKLHRFRGWSRLIIDIACNEHGIRCFSPYDPGYLTEDISLVFDHWKVIYALSYMQIR